MLLTLFLKSERLTFTGFHLFEKFLPVVAIIMSSWPPGRNIVQTCPSKACDKTHSPTVQIVVSVSLLRSKIWKLPSQLLCKMCDCFALLQSENPMWYYFKHDENVKDLGFLSSTPCTVTLRNESASLGLSSLSFDISTTILVLLLPPWGWVVP